MTTIAYRDGVMAADGRITESGTIVTERALKVRKLPDGTIFGFSGSVENGEMLFRFLEVNEAPPALDDVTGFLVRPDGTEEIYEGKVWRDNWDTPYTAFGSGSAHAYTAMDMGADAITAVRMACLRDTISGGEISHVTLEIDDDE